MEETKSLRCTHCMSHHLKHINEEELLCESCNAIVKLNKSIEFEKTYKKLLEENKNVDIKNKRLLVSNSLTPRLDKDNLIRYSQEILLILPEDVLSMFYIKYANRKTNPKDYECYLTNLPNIATKTELDEIIDIIIDNAIFREKDCIENIINSLYKEKQNQFDIALQKRREEAELYSDIKRDIFICHQTNDKKIVDDVLKTLEDDGNICWVSYRNIPWDSDNYWLNIENAIKNCDIFLCISSKNSMQSIDCRKEVELAIKHNKTKKIEYKIDDSKDITLFKNFFTGQWIDNIDTLLEKVYILKHKEQSLYNSGLDYLNKHNYQKAKEIFEEISKYEDSKTYIDLCNIFINTISLIEGKLYNEAKVTLLKTSNFKVADNIKPLIDDLLNKCDKLLLEEELKKANFNINLGLYIDAIDIYKSLILKYNTNFYVWYGYLEAITKGFTDSTNEQISVIYENAYKYANETEKELLLNKYKLLFENKEQKKHNQEKIDKERLEEEAYAKEIREKISKETRERLEKEYLEKQQKHNQEKIDKERLEEEAYAKEIREKISKETRERLEKEYSEKQKNEIETNSETEFINTIIEQTFNTDKVDGEYIYFGQYPQTIKKQNVRIVKEINYNNQIYYLGSDKCLYSKCNAKPFKQTYKFSNSNSIEESKEYYFKIEPVKWRILSKDNDLAFVVSDSILNAHKFDDKINIYECSEIKSYLNKIMINELFTKNQMDLLEESRDGKLFLLSLNHIINTSLGFNEDRKFKDKLRQKEVTDFALANKALCNNKYGWYWLRDYLEEWALHVNELGCAVGDNITRDYNGIAPALQIKINKLKTNKNVTKTIIDYNEKKLINANKKLDFDIKRNHDKIEFGSYPQTLKDKNVEILTKVDNGYYLGSDENFYALVKANIKTDATFSTGEKIINGKEYYFKVEPIEWNPYGNLLITDKIIDSTIFQDEFEKKDNRYYNTTKGTPNDTWVNNYAYSKIRKLIHKEYYNKMFNDKQKEILKLDIKNGIDLKLDLPSEVNLSKLQNIKEFTDYALINGLKGNMFWLKEGNDQISAFVKVVNNGKIDLRDFNYAKVGVCLEATINRNFKTAVGKTNEDVNFSIDRKKLIKCLNEKIVEANIPSGVTRIGFESFANMQDLTKVIIPSNVEKIEKRAFYNCPKLKTVVIKSDTVKIDDEAFKDCVNLSEINLPKEIKEINKSVFENCLGLESITIPKYVLEIKDSAFCNCKNIKEVIFNDNLLIIGKQAFKSCEKIEMLTFPKSLTSIKENAFNGCINVKHLYYDPQKVSIDKTAFKNMIKLENFTITPSLVSKGILSEYTYLSSLTLYGFEGLTFLILNLSNLFSVKDKLDLPVRLKQINIIGTEIVDGSFFKNCIFVTKITFDNNLLTIGERAFENCKMLKEIKLSNSLKQIGDSAFANCNKLEKIIIPESVSRMGTNVFYNCLNTKILCEKKSRPLFNWSKSFAPVKENIVWNYSNK